MRNDQPLGVLLPNDMWESLTEDFEALSSSNFRARIAKARNEKKSSTLAEVKKSLGLG